MVKINRVIINKIVTFLILVGIIILIDEKENISNELVKITVSKIFNIKFLHGIGLDYTPIHASLALILMSEMNIIRKIVFSLGLLVIYVTIAAFMTVQMFRYNTLSLYIWLMTMSIPILIWKFFFFKKMDKMFY